MSQRFDRRDCLRKGLAGMFAGAVVVNGHQTHGRFQRLQPLFERFCPTMPGVVRAEGARRFEHGTLAANLLDPLDKALLALP